MNETVRFVLGPLGAAVGGVVVAGAGLALTEAVASGAEGLGDALVVVVGSLAAVGLGGLVWFSLLVAAARRLFPRGARLTPVLWSVGGVFGVVLLVAAFESLGPVVGATSVIVGTAFAVLVVPSVVFPLLGRKVPPPTGLKDWYLPPEESSLPPESGGAPGSG